MRLPTAPHPPGLPDDPALDADAEAFFDRLMAGALSAPQPADPEPDPADHVGTWRVEGPLGRGGMSRVHRAIRTTAGEPGAGEPGAGEPGAGEPEAALKVGRDAGAAAVDVFAHEARLLRRLDGRPTARVLDDGLDVDGRPYLALELIRGRSVVSASRGMPLPSTVHLLARACRAVGALHSAGVIHGDLKPEHLVVDPGGSIRVLDLGLAVDVRAPGAPRAWTRRSLTPEFAAPEQFLGGHVSYGADVYALGLMLHEALHGRSRRLPWALAAPPAPEAPAGPAGRTATSLDCAVAAVLSTALQPLPYRRYRSAGRMASALEAALSAGPRA